MNKIIDAHIHLDQYTDKAIHKMQTDETIEHIITVSMDKASSIRNLQLSRTFPSVHAAFGFHPEQPICGESYFADLFDWIRNHQTEMIAIGEVGLPHYERLKDPKSYPLEPYLELLEQFILLAKELQKPIVLHCIYEEATLALDLLEKHSYMAAQFHWFKGSSPTLERMMRNGCYLSFTPDIHYEHDIQLIAKNYSPHRIMAETDGPWPFEGPFQNMKTTPAIIHQSIEKIAELKQITTAQCYKQISANTKAFFAL